MAEAAAAAKAAGRPWTLDPVAVGATAARREAGARLLALKPDVIRGNASEILALAGMGGSGRGVDAGDSVAAAEAAARGLAQRSGAVVAVTGETDFVTDGARAFRVHGGSALMPQVTALGCALSALTASFCAVEPDRLAATVSALAFYAAAGERAAVGAAGPGSFAVAFLDALAGVAPGDIGAERVRAA
jgi:hydroxyethylthiazole kinase